MDFLNCFETTRPFGRQSRQSRTRKERNKLRNWWKWLAYIWIEWTGSQVNTRTGSVTSFQLMQIMQVYVNFDWKEDSTMTNRQVDSLFQKHIRICPYGQVMTCHNKLCGHLETAISMKMEMVTRHGRIHMKCMKRMVD